MDKNVAGYQITDYIAIEGERFALGHNPKAPAPYGVWKTNEVMSQFWFGRYFAHKHAAISDMVLRATYQLERPTGFLCPWISWRKMLGRQWSFDSSRRRLRKRLRKPWRISWMNTIRFALQTRSCRNPGSLTEPRTDTSISITAMRISLSVRSSGISLTRIPSF